MKIKKRITIIADVLVDEDFDCNYLCICQDVGEDVQIGGTPSIYVGRSNDFEITEYVYQNEVEIAK